MTPYLQGYTAASEHFTLSDDNPYTVDTEEYDEWLRGYNQWQEDYQTGIN